MSIRTPPKARVPQSICVCVFAHSPISPSSVPPSFKPFGSVSTPSYTQRCSFSGKEDHKDDEEDDENEEYLDHEPAIGGDGLEVLQYLGVGHFHIQLGVLHVGVNPGGQQETWKAHDFTAFDNN